MRLQSLDEFALDGLALRSIRRLESDGIRVLLGKGPVTRSWLGLTSEDHPYTDVDLFVDPSEYEHACGVLRSMGFFDFHADVLGLYRPWGERAWVSADGSVDLHRGSAGVPVQNWGRAWDLMFEGRTTFELRGHPVDTMGFEVRAFHLALHAAQGSSGIKARNDLIRAASTLAIGTWRVAADLAGELEATTAFTAGLAAAAEGRRILGELHLEHVPTVVSILSAQSASPGALFIANVAAQPWPIRAAAVRSCFSIENASMPQRRAWYLRVAALSRLPVALLELICAVGALHRGQSNK